MTRTYLVETYGCQMNERDSEAVAAQLVAKGYTLAASEDLADVVLLNTCSVRDAAEQKVFHECLLHVHPVLAPARSLRLLHVRCADMSLR